MRDASGRAAGGVRDNITVKLTEADASQLEKRHLQYDAGLTLSPGDYTLPNVNLTGYAPGFPGASAGFVGYGTHIVQNNIYYRGSETATRRGRNCD